MFENALRAAKLDVEFYNAVEHDDSLTAQAATFVAVVGVLTGVGRWIFSDGNLIRGMIMGVITSVLAWLLWSAITTWVGVRFFGGTSDFKEMSRVLGFAHAPLLLGIVGPLGVFVGSLWTVASGIVAIREGMDFSLGKAIATGGIGLILRLIAGFFLPFV